MSYNFLEVMDLDYIEILFITICGKNWGKMEKSGRDKKEKESVPLIGPLKTILVTVGNHSSI